MQLAIVGFYFALLLGAGFVKRWLPKGDADYLLAGRRVTLLPFVATMVSTAYGWVMGVGQMYAEYGISAWLFLSLPYTLTALVLAFFFAQRARKQEFSTISELLDQQYGKRVSTLGTLFFVLVCLPSMYLLMAGQVIHFLTDWSVIVGVGVAALFSTLYLYSGGFKAVVKTDIFQFFLMFGGFAMLLIVLVVDHGWEKLAEAPPGHLKMSMNYSGWYIASWFLLAAFTLMDPNFYQRIYAVDKPKTARNGLLISILLWTCFDFLAAAAAIYGIVLIPNSGDHALIYLELGQAALPPALAGLFFVALLSAIMSTADSFIFYSSLTLAKDIFHRNTMFSSIPLQKLTQFCLFGVTLAGFLICIPYRNGTVIDLFFDLYPVAVSSLLLPVLTAYFPRFSLSGSLVLVQMSISALVCLVYQIFHAKLILQFPYLENINSIYPGLATAILFHIFGLWSKSRIPAKFEE